MFGVTHVCAIDGYSGKVVAFGSMPVKNNMEIYKRLFRLLYIFAITSEYYRPAFITYGLWDQIHVDHGREWMFSLYLQETLQHLQTSYLLLYT
jgi:hypothetical protein